VYNFSGTYEHPIDEKGRLNVPVDIRAHLRGDEPLIVTNFVIQKVRCLRVYPQDSWEQVTNRLRATPEFNKKFNVFKLYYLGGAHTVQMDKQGRLLIPPRLREYAALNKNAVVVGETDRFSIWDHAAHATVFEAGEQMLMDEDDFLSEI
jgi:MraZ protein